MGAACVLFSRVLVDSGLRWHLALPFLVDIHLGAGKFSGLYCVCRPLYFACLFCMLS